MSVVNAGGPLNSSAEVVGRIFEQFGVVEVEQSVTLAQSASLNSS
jgi:hypothetical protein